MLNTHRKDWCWSWNSNTLATWCQELTHWKRPWYWERLKAGGEGDNRGWDDWMASLTRWTWIWAGSGSWWWTGRPGVLWFMGLQRVRHDRVTELNWTKLNVFIVMLQYTKMSSSFYWKSGCIPPGLKAVKIWYLIVQYWGFSLSPKSGLKALFVSKYSCFYY